MAPEYDFEDDGREIELRRLRAEVDRVQQEVRRQREGVRFAEDVAMRLRGRTISEDAYVIIREAIEHARYDRFHRRNLTDMEYEHEMRRRQIMEEKYMMIQEYNKRMPDKMYIFDDWEKIAKGKMAKGIKEKEEEKDFLEESDMEL